MSQLSKYSSCTKVLIYVQTIHVTSTKAYNYAFAAYKATPLLNIQTFNQRLKNIMASITCCGYFFIYALLITSLPTLVVLP